MKTGVDLEKVRKEIESGELDEAIGEELDREVGLTAEDIALFESVEKTNVAGKKARSLQVKRGNRCIKRPKYSKPG